MQKSLELHNEIIARVLGHLLDHGVKAIEFSSEEFLSYFSNRYQSLEEFDDDFADVVSWLKDEGYIRYQAMVGGTEGETCVVNCQLTSSAIAMLAETAEGSNASKRELIQAGNSGDARALESIKAGIIFGGAAGSRANSGSIS